MKKLSIKAAVSNAFVTYKNNFLTLAPLGIFIGIMEWAYAYLPGLLSPILFPVSPTEQLINPLEQQSLFTLGQKLTSGIYTSSDITIFATQLGLSVILALIYGLTYFTFLKHLIKSHNISNLSIPSLFAWDSSIVRVLTSNTCYLLAFVPPLLFVNQSIHPTLKIMLLFIFSLIGLFLMLRICLFSFFMLDKNIGFIEAVKQSWKATHSSFTKLVVAAFLSGAVMRFFTDFFMHIIGPNKATFIILIAPTFFTIPFVALLFINVYHQL